MNSRSGEDPLSVIISSLENLAGSAKKINKKIVHSLFLLIGWCILEFFLWGLSIVKLSIFDLISSTILLVIVLFVIIEVLDVREKLAVVVSRYQAYKFMENMDLKIPEGKDPVERFIRYLNKNFNFEEKIKKRGGKILKNSNINCGKEVYFDLYAEIKKGIFDKLLGRKSYSFYLLKEEEVNIERLKDVVKDIKGCHSRNGLEIGRVVLITKKIDDNAYEYLLSQKIDIPLQAVIEMEDGTYDFIPFISPRPDMLP